MAAQVGREGGHHDLVAEPGRYLVVASRAAVRLHRFVRLDMADVHRSVRSLLRLRSLRLLPAHPSRAQSTSAITTSNAAATKTMSLRRLTWARNGLKPTGLP